MRKILKDYGIRTAFRTGCTLAKLLTRVKDPTKKEEIMGAVYKIKCICGDFYIGKSGRALGERIKEHKAACKYAHFDKSQWLSMHGKMVTTKLIGMMYFF